MVRSHPVVADLCAVVGADGVLDDPDALHAYESDGFPIARGLPTAAVFPRTTEQVAACVRVLRKHGMPIVPRGSGTGLTGGAVAYGQGVILSTARMTRIESIDIPNRVAVVQAGVLNAMLSEAVAATPGGEGLHFAPTPSSQKACTIGGNAATNAGGLNTLKYGVTCGHILGMELVTADGSILTTRAGALTEGIGPDLPALLCGSEGTLALITRLWCRLTPRPRQFRTLYAVFSASRDACQTVSDIIASGLVPASLEMMDGQMIRVVEEAFRYGFSPAAQALLLIEIDGVEQALDEQMDQIIDICQRHGAFDIRRCADPVQRAQLWSVRKRAFGAIGRISPGYCTQDACIPRSRLADALEYFAELGRRYGVTISNVFHAGDGNVHPVLLFDEHDPRQVQRTLRLSKDILEYCIGIGGTLTGEHGVGVEKIHLMEKMFNPATIRLFQRIKRAWDPDGLLNEGKLIPSDRLRIQLLETEE